MLALGLIGWLLTLTPLAADEAVSPRSLTNQLAGASSDDKLRIARALTAHDEGVAVIELLARGALFLDRRTGQVVAGERRGARYRLSDVFSDAALGEGGRRDVRRLKVDNALREQLQNLLAIAALTDPQPAQRAQAIAAILAAPTPATLAALAARADDEPEAALRDEIAVGLALADLASTDAAVVARGLETLRRSSRDSVRTALRGVAGRADLPAALRDRAARQLAAAERRLAWAARAESLFFGLSLGSVLLLSAVGLAITFGVMGVINMAHGELIMLGAYTTWLLQQWLPAQPGVALLLAIPAAFLVSGLIGLAIERGVIRFLYGRPLETLLATFGISLILQQAVRSLFSPLNRAVATPDWLSGALPLLPGLAVTWNRLAILFFSLLVFAALQLFMQRSRLGLEVRAVAQNRAMARALGVRSARVDALTFTLGSGVAGVAGVALSQLTNVGPNLGQAYIIDSFLVVVFGGVGNLWGTLVAAFSLGVANKLLEPVAGAVLAKILLLVALILFLQRRPQGLFPRLGREDAP
jgi:urea transport system permease protein